MSEDPFEKFQIDKAAFYETMAGDDLLKSIILGAIHIENQLIRFIEENMQSEHVLKVIRVTFRDRLNIAVEVGLPQKYASPVLALAEIRNKFAHKLNAQFGEKEAADFVNKFSPSDRKQMLEIYKQTKQKLGGSHPDNFVDLPPIDKFVFCITFLRGSIIGARKLRLDLAKP